MFSRQRCGLTVWGDIDVVKKNPGFKPKDGRLWQYDEETHTNGSVTVKDIEKCHDWFIKRGRVCETEEELAKKKDNPGGPGKPGGGKKKKPKKGKEAEQA